MTKSNGFEYRMVDISTIAGMEEAEELQRQGYRIISVGMFSVTLERKAA